MSTVPTYFADFLSQVRLTSRQVADCKTGHETLRKRLHADPDLSPIVVESFLQGSYRRATAVRPTSDSSKSDVDVIVVTSINKEEETPAEALDRFQPFLEKHYKGKYRRQGRSWGIELSYVELDLVPTAAPTEVDRKIVTSRSILTNMTLEEATDWRATFRWLEPERRPTTSTSPFYAMSSRAAEWRAEPLWIPDREADEWDETDPLTQILVTQQTNGLCNGHFVNVVKSLKWWRKAMQPKPKYPKSYPLEHLIWLRCPDGVSSVAEGVTLALESIRDSYAGNAAAKRTPFIPDHGVPHHDVLHRVSGDDFAGFHALVEAAATVAREALDEKDIGPSVRKWRKLFGDRFPPPPDDRSEGNGSSDPGGYTERTKIGAITTPRFA